MAIKSKNVRMRFISDEGKKFTLSMGYPNPALEEEGGSDLAQSVVDVVIDEQAMTRTIDECEAVEVVERSVKRVL